MYIYIYINSGMFEFFLINCQDYLSTLNCVILVHLRVVNYYSWKCVFHQIWCTYLLELVTGFSEAKNFSQNEIGIYKKKKKNGN